MASHRDFEFRVMASSLFHGESLVLEDKLLHGGEGIPGVGDANTLGAGEIVDCAALPEPITATRSSPPPCMMRKGGAC